MKYLFFLIMMLWTAYRAYLLWQKLKNNTFFQSNNDKNSTIDYEDVIDVSSKNRK